MRSPGTDRNHFARKVKVYDVKNKKLIMTFDSMSQAKEYTGVLCISRYIQKKSKSYKNKLGITLAFR